MATAKKLDRSNNYYLKLDFSVLSRTDLGPFAKILYSYLSFRQNNHSCCWPKVKTIARDLGTTQPTIQKAKKELVAAGLLLVVSGKGGYRGSNKYTVIPTDEPARAEKTISQEKHKHLVPFKKERKLTEKNKQPVVVSDPVKAKQVGRLLQKISHKHNKQWPTAIIKPYAERWAATWPTATIAQTAAKWAKAANNPALIEFYLKRQPTQQQANQRQQQEQQQREKQAADRERERAETVVHKQGEQAHKQRMAGLAKAFGM